LGFLSGHFVPALIGEEIKKISDDHSVSPEDVLNAVMSLIENTYQAGYEACIQANLFGGKD